MKVLSTIWWLGLGGVCCKLLFVRSSLLIFVAERSSGGEWHHSRLAQWFTALSRATGCDLAASMGEEAWKLFKILFPLPGHLLMKILTLEPVSALIFCCWPSSFFLPASWMEPGYPCCLRLMLLCLLFPTSCVCHSHQAGCRAGSEVEIRKKRDAFFSYACLPCLTHWPYDVTSLIPRQNACREQLSASFLC